MPKVKVYCRLVNGLMIRLASRGLDDGVGGRMPGFDGAGIRLNGPSAVETGVGMEDGRNLEPGVTEVDADWFARWLEQNEHNQLVTGGMIYRGEAIPDEEKTSDPL